jgi:wyosine [tRNA(Phe)-imidazoG37] synthetase (radical SAM superfamily)
MIVFGPIPSRRLGRSLGINNIPPKICSYSCIYCQIGVTDSMSIERKKYYTPNDILEEVSSKVKQLQDAGEEIDFLTFVPDGEPTLDINLGKEIDLLKSLGIKIAVITNSSLLWDENVRKDLMKADWVSVKIDTVDEKIWHRLNRPHGKLELQEIIHGIKTFASAFKGKLVTETMLVKGINDGFESIKRTAEIINWINPDRFYLLVPTRPPAEKFVEPPSEELLNTAYQAFRDSISNVELLAYNEGVDFSYTSDVEKELLSILAVHPMRQDAIDEFMKKADADKSLISSLTKSKKIKEVLYNNNSYYVKNIRR